MVQIERLSKETLPGLVDCERASVDKWFLYHSLTEKEETTYDELSPFQRWIHGGPTMDLSIATNYWQESKQETFDPNDIFVAREDSTIAGFIGAFYGEEAAIPGKHAYIDLLLIRPKKRRLGIASKLLEKVEQTARRNGCDSLLVYPEELAGPSGQFYLRNGFSIWKKRFILRLPTIAKPSFEPYLQPAPLKRNATWRLIIGWHSTSLKAWFLLHSSFEEEFFKAKRLVYTLHAEGLSPALLGGICWHPVFQFGAVYLWFSGEKQELSLKHISALQFLGHLVGLKQINLVFLEELLPCIQNFSLNDQPRELEPFLIKKIAR
ncbi:MAG: GNAT family N-acetyltransferase [Candidatus Heimdallarchaeota archaeon]